MYCTALLVTPACEDCLHCKHDTKADVITLHKLRQTAKQLSYCYQKAMLLGITLDGILAAHALTVETHRYVQCRALTVCITSYNIPTRTLCHLLLV